MVSISYKLSITWKTEIIRTHFGQVNMHFVAADRLRQEIERQHCGQIYTLLSKNYEVYFYLKIEIKTFDLVLEFKYGTGGWTEHWLRLPKNALTIVFWPLTAFKNIDAHVTIQRILNTFTEINFSVECMVWLWCWLFQQGLPLKILIRYLNLF